MIKGARAMLSRSKTKQRWTEFSVIVGTLILLFGFFGIRSIMAQAALENFKNDVSILHLGTPIDHVRASINGSPMAVCNTDEQLAQVMKSLGNEFPAAVRKVRGQVLIYRLHKESEYLVCLYFDKWNRLIEVAEAWHKDLKR